MATWDRNSTTDDVLAGLDLSGRRVMITGAASGLGKESARALAARGASVTVLARSEERARSAVGELEELVPGGRCSPGVVDLADLSSIRAFTDTWLDGHDAFDVLINNAGVMATPYSLTVDGFETQFGTNHLGHFLLTARLAPALLRGDDPRVVTLSSAGHARADVDLVDWNFATTPYDAWVAYGRSKSANALFARELARRAGSDRLLSFSVHPGGIITDLGRHLTEDLMNDMMRMMADRATAAEAAGQGPGEPFSFKSVQAGAATQVWAATATGLAGQNGAYLADCGPGVPGASPDANGFESWIVDDGRAGRLWELSEELVSEAFPI